MQNAFSNMQGVQEASGGSDIGLWILLGLFIFACIMGWFSIVITEQQKLKFVQRLGKFKRIARPGLSFRVPIFDQVAGELSLKLDDIDTTTRTKTQDNVFVDVGVTIQYQVNPVVEADDKSLQAAFYRLRSPERQINSYIEDKIRALVPKEKLSDLFENKDKLALDVKTDLDARMKEFGYDIVGVLVTDIQPDGAVVDALNNIRTAEAKKVASQAEAEANKILNVTKAQADKESAILRGEGIAGERKAIAEGFNKSIEKIKEGNEALSTSEILGMLLTTQYIDGMKQIAEHSNVNTIFMPSEGTAGVNLANSIAKGIISAK